MVEWKEPSAERSYEPRATPANSAAVVQANKASEENVVFRSAFEVALERAADKKAGKKSEA